MKTSLTKGLDKDLADEVSKSYKGCSIFRRQLTKLLKDKIETTRALSRKPDNYLESNWALKQVGLIEKENAFLEVISLLEDKE